MGATTIKKLCFFTGLVYLIAENTCYGGMQFSLQLNNYSNTNYQLASNSTTCGYTAFGQMVVFCQFQFTTIISFTNAKPVTISTHLIPPDNTSMINFNNTVLVKNCPPLVVQNFQCNDSTWQTPYSQQWNTLRPISVHVVVTHYGNIAYQGNLVPPDSFVPTTSWYVDTYYLDLLKVIPTPSNASTPQNTSFMLPGTQNIGALGLTVTMQCLGNWWGPDCSFSSCTPNDDDNSYMSCKTADYKDNRFLCKQDPATGQPINCQYCSEGINEKESTCSTSGSGPTQYKSTKGYTAGLIVLGIIVLILLIIVIAGSVYFCKKQQKSQPSSSSNARVTNTSSYQATGKQKGKGNDSKGNYRPAPIAEPEPEWPDGNRRQYNENFPSDEYSTPSRNGNRQEAAV